MKGIKNHTHEEREEIIRRITPLIEKKFGDNLLALAVCCSFARNDDTDYSDLELTAIVKEMPEGQPRGGLAKIFDGMLIELVWMTRETYLKTTKDVNEFWHYSGSDRLIPVINPELIAELNAYEPADLKQQCLDQAIGSFPEYQEAVSKVLNAIKQENHEGMPVVFGDMITQTLRLLSFLNQIPYVTASRMFSQAREFPMKPASLNRLLDLAVVGEYRDFPTLHDISVAVFEEFEVIFEKLGLQLYDDDIDPERVAHRLRQIQGE